MGKEDVIRIQHTCVGNDILDKNLELHRSTIRVSEFYAAVAALKGKIAIVTNVLQQISSGPNTFSCQSTEIQAGIVFSAP